jgi:hypothetical protein
MPRKRLTARERELSAASRPQQRSCGSTISNEVEGMLARRGFRACCSRPELPFPDDFSEIGAEELCVYLHHYAFRLFLRGAIRMSSGFAPREATRYVEPARAKEFAERLVALGLAGRIERGRYRMRKPAHSFGGLLEWFVARELRRTLGFDVMTRVQLRAGNVGGDLDVVAAAESRLYYFELKSSPPRHLTEIEVKAFYDRLKLLRPDAAFFIVDTALRLSDKVIPLLSYELARRGANAAPALRFSREVWMLTPWLAVVGAHPDLIGNIRRAMAGILRGHAPHIP